MRVAQIKYSLALAGASARSQRRPRLSGKTSVRCASRHEYEMTTTVQYEGLLFGVCLCRSPTPGVRVFERAERQAKQTLGETHPYVPLP